MYVNTFIYIFFSSLPRNKYCVLKEFQGLFWNKKTSQLIFWHSRLAGKNFEIQLFSLLLEAFKKSSNLTFSFFEDSIRKLLCPFYPKRIFLFHKLNLNKTANFFQKLRYFFSQFFLLPFNFRCPKLRRKNFLLEYMHKRRDSRLSYLFLRFPFFAFFSAVAPDNRLKTSSFSLFSAKEKDDEESIHA